MVAPGLQPNGADEPRLDRFARVLAGAGIPTVVPALPDFMCLRVRPSVVSDFATVLERALSHLPDATAHLLAISFGSLPALRVASNPRFASALGGIFVFGGYADLHDVMRFVLAGGERSDPLDRCVLFANLLEWMPRSVDDPAAVRQAWVEFARTTWGNPSMREPQRYAAVARGLAQPLSPDDAHTVLLGCGIERDREGEALCAAALETLGAEAEALAHSIDPRADLDGLRAPVTLAHGRDDDVIPWQHSQQLADAIGRRVPTQTHLTGLYDHAQGAGAGLWSRPRAVASEAWTLLRLLEALGRPASFER